MPTYPLTYLVCPACEQIHYFRAVPIKNDTLIRYNHPQDPDDPTQFKTDCQTCLAMQENDQPTLTRALDHTRANPLHAEAMTTVDELTKTDLVTAVLACPQCRSRTIPSSATTTRRIQTTRPSSRPTAKPASPCGETSLFNTNWKGDVSPLSGPSAWTGSSRFSRKASTTNGTS